MLNHDQFASVRADIAQTMSLPGTQLFWNSWKVARRDTRRKFKAHVDGLVASGAAPGLST